MPFINPSIDIFVFTSLLVVAPSWYILNLRQRPPRAPPKSNTQNASLQPTRPPYEHVLTLLVHLHTLYMIYLVTMCIPPNLFTMLHIPLVTPSDRIRHILLRRAGLASDDTLPRALEELLTKLSNADVRVSYVRFGQTVIQDCVFCRTTEDYALFAVVGPLLQYIREAFVMGLLTVENGGRSQWRMAAMVSLVVAFVAEVYTAATAPISIPRDGKGVMMWHDILYIGRHIVFLALPIILYLLPASIPVPLMPQLLQTRFTLESLQRRVALMKIMHPSIIRDEKLHEASHGWWTKQKTIGKWLREDDEVRRVTGKLVGAGNQPDVTAVQGEEMLKQRIRDSVKELLKGI